MALFTLLQELQRFRALVRSKHGIDLRFGALFFHDQVVHDLGLFLSEGACLLLIEFAVNRGVLRLFILAKLLH